MSGPAVARWLAELIGDAGRRGLEVAATADEMSSLALDIKAGDKLRRAAIEGLAQLGSDDSIYRTMARDIYQNGTVLAHKKYRMLGWAYRLFLVGRVLNIQM